MSDTINKRVVLQIGGMSTMSGATGEAKEFTNPRVFSNRSAFFPNPVTHKVKLTVVSSVPKAWPKPPSPMNAFYVELTLKVEGEKKAVDTWVSGAQSKIKLSTPTAYGTTTERSKHLAEIGKAPQGGTTVTSPAKSAISDREQNALDRGLPPPKKEGAKVVGIPALQPGPMPGAKAGFARTEMPAPRRTARIEEG